METARTPQGPQPGLFTALLQDAARVQRGAAGILDTIEAQTVLDQWQQCRQTGASFRYRWSSRLLGQEPSVIDIVANPVDRSNPGESTWIAVETDVTKAVRTEIQSQLFESAVEKGWKLDYCVVVFEQLITFLSPRLQHYLRLSPGESDWIALTDALGIHDLVSVGQRPSPVREADLNGQKWTIRFHQASEGCLTGQLFALESIEVSEGIRSAVQLMDRPTWLYSEDLTLVDQNAASADLASPDAHALLESLGSQLRAEQRVESGTWEIRRWFGSFLVFFMPSDVPSNKVLNAAERILKRKIDVGNPEIESVSWLRKVPGAQQVAVAASMINSIRDRTEFTVHAGEESWSGAPIEGTDDWLIARGASEAESTDLTEMREIDLSAAMAILDTIKKQLIAKGHPVQQDALDQVQLLVNRHRIIR